MLGLHCCAQSFSSCGEWRLLFCNSCCSRASHCGAFSCCGAQVIGLASFRSCDVRHALVIKPISAALAGRFLATGLPGRPEDIFK